MPSNVQRLKKDKTVRIAQVATIIRTRPDPRAKFYMKVSAVFRLRCVVDVQYLRLGCVCLFVCTCNEFIAAKKKGNIFH